MVGKAFSRMRFGRCNIPISNHVTSCLSSFSTHHAMGVFVDRDMKCGEVLCTYRHSLSIPFFLYHLYQHAYLPDDKRPLDDSDPPITLNIFRIEIVDVGPTYSNATEYIILSFRNVTLPMCGHKTETEKREIVFWGHRRGNMRGQPRNHQAIKSRFFCSGRA